MRCRRSSISEYSIRNSREPGARRRLLRAGLAAGAWLALSAHSPYRQWEVHRKARLVLLVSRSDERSVALGRGIAALYAARLPESQASVARAKDENDLLRLLASKQLDVAVLRAGRYAANDGLALRAIAALGEHVLVCREDLPKATAYLLAETLAEAWSELDAALPREISGLADSATIPLHPGALEYYRDHR